MFFLSSLDRINIAHIRCIRRAPDSPSRPGLVHQSSRLSTLLLDACIVSPLTSIDFSMQFSVPKTIPEEGLSVSKTIPEEGLSSQGLNLFINLECAPLPHALSHLRTILIPYEVLRSLNSKKATKVFKIAKQLSCTFLLSSKTGVKHLMGLDKRDGQLRSTSLSMSCV